MSFSKAQMTSNEETKDVISAHVENPPEVAREDLVDTLAHDTNVYFTVEEEKRVLSKIDWRVLPLMLGAYFLQQLDKSSLSYIHQSSTSSKMHTFTVSSILGWGRFYILHNL